MTMTECPNVERPLSGRRARIDLPETWRVDAHTNLAGDEYFVVTLADGSTITDQNEVASFVLNNTNHTITKDTNNMTAYDIRNQANGTYDQASALIERFNPLTGAPVLQRIGSKATTAKQRLEVGRMWADLDSAFGCGYVSLDTDPAVPGRPEQLAPGVPMVKLIELPEWHPLYKGKGDVAVVFYTPVTTWVSRKTVIDRTTGALVESEKELASGRDATGYHSVVAVVELTAEGCEEWVAAMRKAVRILAVGETAPVEAHEMDDLNRDDARARVAALLSL